MFFAKLTQKARPLKETSVILRKILLPYSVNFYDWVKDILMWILGGEIKCIVFENELFVLK